MRWLLTWKLDEEINEKKAKARAIILGCQDPRYLPRPTAAPSPTRSFGFIIMVDRADSVHLCSWRQHFVDEDPNKHRACHTWNEQTDHSKDCWPTITGTLFWPSRHIGTCSLDRCNTCKQVQQSGFNRRIFVGTSNRKLREGLEAKVSAIPWRSGRIEPCMSIAGNGGDHGRPRRWRRAHLSSFPLGRVARVRYRYCRSGHIYTTDSRLVQYRCQRPVWQIEPRNSFSEMCWKTCWEWSYGITPKPT